MPLCARESVGVTSTAASSAPAVIRRKKLSVFMFAESIEVPRLVHVRDAHFLADGNAERTRPDLRLEMSFALEAQVIAVLHADHCDVALDADNAEKFAGDAEEH